MVILQSVQTIGNYKSLETLYVIIDNYEPSLLRYALESIVIIGLEKQLYLRVQSAFQRWTYVYIQLRGDDNLWIAIYALQHAFQYMHIRVTLDNTHVAL